MLLLGLLNATASSLYLTKFISPEMSLYPP